MKRFLRASALDFSVLYYHNVHMAYCTINIDWLPGGAREWATFTAVRKEAGRLWSWLVERHASSRQAGEEWPTKAQLQKEIQRKFPGLHSQSAQQTVADFCEAIASAESIRRKGEPFEYPHRKTMYRQVIFTNQGAKYRDGLLILPCGKDGKLTVRIPKGVVLPGRLIEVRLDYGRVEIVCEVALASPCRTDHRDRSRREYADRRHRWRERSPDQRP